MLSQTIRENLTTLYGTGVRTKATNLGEVKPSVTNPAEIRKQLERTYRNSPSDPTLSTKMHNPVKSNKNISTDNDYIVEDPNQIVVEISAFKSTSSDSKLPFFKSLQIKLFNI